MQAATFSRVDIFWLPCTLLNFSRRHSQAETIRALFTTSCAIITSESPLNAISSRRHKLHIIGRTFGMRQEADAIGRRHWRFYRCVCKSAELVNIREVSPGWVVSSGYFNLWWVGSNWGSFTVSVASEASDSNRMPKQFRASPWPHPTRTAAAQPDRSPKI